MALIRDNRPLHEFLRELVKLTGFQICIYDLSFFLNRSPKLTIPHEFRIHRSAYCTCVKSEETALKRCMETENWRTAQAGQKKAPFLHTCYAGVTDLIFPLIVHGKQIGAIFFGQILSVKDRETEAAIAELARTHGHDEAALSDAAARMPRVPASRLRACAKLVALVREYLEQSEELIELKREKLLLMEGEKAVSAAATKVRIEQVPLFVIEQLQLNLSQVNAPQVKKALAYLRNNYWLNPSHRELARMSGMSESQFSREFSRLTGMTYRHCILSARLESAFYLIKRHMLTLEESAAAVGYENCASMQRAFKKFTGLSPRQYIRRYPRAFRLERFEDLSDDGGAGKGAVASSAVKSRRRKGAK